MFKAPHSLLLLSSALLATIVLPLHAQDLHLIPLKSSGIYSSGEDAGWHVEKSGSEAAKPGVYHYVLKKNGRETIQSGSLDLQTGAQTISVRGTEAAMLFLEITQDGGKRQLAGAAIEPSQLKPVCPRPADFDAFWSAQIAKLKNIPAKPELKAAASGREGVDYATLRLDNIDGSHVYGQLAKPTRKGKFPAILILQWAGGPYPLQKSWVTDRAAEGWLALNIEPHDVPGDLPAEFYAALPQLIKRYNSIYDNDRERCYFLRMYLGAYRALDYLADDPDWDGKTLLVMGSSMGGQQSLAVAGLHPKVTHVMANVPAGADANAALHGRAESYPNWDSSKPAVMETARYFDTINFAPRIKATCLVSMGFIDETCPPAGVWTLFNLIPGPKEVAPLIEAGHNNASSREQQRLYNERSQIWLDALVRGKAAPVQANPVTH
jgi:cephalosporin-C deacetylase-like acetyl esterase